MFVLATTDPQKVLPTIRSRTQHYEFHLLDSDVLALLLADIARDAQLDLPESAVESAVHRGRGSARDALSALDQVVASGVVDDASPLLRELLVALVERDTARALQVVETALVSGRDAPRIAGELLEELRGQFLAAVAPALPREGEPPQATPGLPHGGQDLLLGPARSVRAMEVLGTALVAMRDALDARITLEVAIVRLTHPEVDDDSSALLERIERLERRIQTLTGPAVALSPPPPPPPPATASSRTTLAGATSPEPEEQLSMHQDMESQPALGAFAQRGPSGADRPGPPEPTTSPPGSPARTGAPFSQPVLGDGLAAEPSDESALPPPTRDELVAAWGDHVLSQLRPRVRAVFAVGRFLATEGATAILALPNSAHVERASFDCEEVAEALSRYFGHRVQLRLVAETNLGAAHSAPVSSTSGPHGRPQVAGESQGTPAASAGMRGDAHRAAARVSTMSDVPIRVASARRAPGGAGTVDLDEEMIDPDELDPNGESVAGDTLSWAQDRVMEAFPGAEEV